MTDIIRDKPGSLLADTIRDTGPLTSNLPPPTQHSASQLIFPFLTANGSDQITPLIRDAAEKHRLSSLKNFSTNLTILNPAQKEASLRESGVFLHPPTWGRSIRDTSRGFLGWNCYYFDISGSSNEPIPLEVRLLTPHKSRSGDAPHPPGIRIRYASVWLKVSTFLDHYPPNRALRDWNQNQKPKSLWENQGQWWVALSRLPAHNPMHKTFRILALSGEIREIIYSHILPSPYNPYPRLRSRKLVGLAKNGWLAAQPDRQLTLLNRQIHYEASKVLFSNTVWLIPKFNLLDRVLLNSYFTTRLQRLRLALDHASFVRLFTADSIVAVASLRPLREMNLREFVLDFASPPGAYKIWLPDGSEKRMVVCQRTIIGWILEAAEYWVLGHEGVKVKGCVSEEQRTEFEGKCRDGLREFKVWREMDCVEGKGLGDWDAWREDAGGVRLPKDMCEIRDQADKATVNGEEGGLKVKDSRTLNDYLGGTEPPECFCEKSCEVVE